MTKGITEQKDLHKPFSHMLQTLRNLKKRTDRLLTLSQKNKKSSKVHNSLKLLIVKNLIDSICVNFK